MILNSEYKDTKLEGADIETCFPDIIPGEFNHWTNIYLKFWLNERNVNISLEELEMGLTLYHLQTECVSSK